MGVTLGKKQLNKRKNFSLFKLQSQRQSAVKSI